METSTQNQSNFLVLAFLVSLAYYLIIVLMDRALV